MSSPDEKVTRALVASLAAAERGPVKLLRVAQTPLPRGEQAAAPQRLDVEYEAFPRNGAARRRFVWKHTTEREISVMHALLPLAANRALPTLVGSGVDSAGHWMLTPWLAGQPWGSYELPLDVAAALARVHFTFEGRAAELSFLPRLDQNHWHALLDTAEHALPGCEPAFAKQVREHLKRLRSASEVMLALSEQPQTLLHGDVHPGNMIQSGRGATLIDWGEALVGPAAVDLANCTDDIHAAPFQHYWQRKRELGSTIPESRELERAHDAATAFVNLNYLPFALARLDQAPTETLLRKAVAAAGRLASQRRS